MLRSSIPSTITITEHIEPSAGPVFADSTYIHQIIMNLCTNAYQAMQETGGRLEVLLTEAQIGYEETVKRIGIRMGPHLHLTVKDEGVGMEPAVLERIFEPYYTTKEPGKGTGLGLSVIHGIVKNHGGFITVESAPGKGSAFHVYLPTLEGVATEIEVAASAAKSGGSERILLVDDEPQIVDMQKQMLEKLGYRVSVRTSSADALETFMRQPDRFDLVITDMTMPHMAGDQLARRIWDVRPGIPVILCTGYNEMISEDKAIAMGIRKFLLKPIDKDELAAAIRSSLSAPPPPYPAPRDEPAPAAAPPRGA